MSSTKTFRLNWFGRPGVCAMNTSNRPFLDMEGAVAFTSGTMDNISPDNSPTLLAGPGFSVPNLMLNDNGIPMRFLQPGRGEVVPCYGDPIICSAILRPHWR